MIGLGRHRLIGFAAALVLGSLVAAALFEIMGLFARAPTSSRRLRSPLPVSIVALPEVSRPARRARPPPPTTQARAAGLPASARLRTTRAVRHVNRRPLVLDFALPPVLSPANTRPAVSRRGNYIDWRGPLNDYLREQEKKSPPFAAPIPPQPPAAPGLPVRMRFSGGFEIDRIGNTCYAVTADEASTRPSGANTSQLQVWHAMLPLFAHEVSCEPGATLSLGQEFLERLRKRGYPKKPSGP